MKTKVDQKSTFRDGSEIRNEPKNLELDRNQTKNWGEKWTKN